MRIMDSKVKIIIYFTLIIGINAQNNKLPDDFIVGFASASYQVEGAWNEGGKGENVWDRMTHTYPDAILDSSNGDIATNQYHKYKEDVQIMKNLGAQMYRFSLSWSRIIPDIQNYQVNSEGIDYYNRLIDNLIENGIKPMVTLSHWDLPQYLQELGGWPNPALIDYFEDYARIAFNAFGDRVKHWITFNEPLETCMLHYGSDGGAPRLNMSGIADYMCTHTILQAHARAYHLYNDTFKPTQKGICGITLNGGFNAPLTNSTEDIEAAQTMNLFQIGWFADPIFSSKGDYPEVMRRNIDKNSAAEGRPKSRLPTFDKATVKYIRGTYDFYGMNHYSTRLSTPSKSNGENRTKWEKDANVDLSVDPSWAGSASSWLQVVPWGFRGLINFVTDRYNHVPIIITENGYSDHPREHDPERVSYYHDYIEQVLKAIYEDGCNVKGYMAWSILDNFEWMVGYTERFGVVLVDFSDPERKRTLKDSAYYLKDVYTTRVLSPVNSKNWSEGRDQNFEIKIVH